MKNRIFGDYNVIKQIGQGSLGAVYLAEHRFMKRHYALKVLPEELASDRSFIQRFEEGVAQLAQLDHPNIVKIHNVSYAEGSYFLVMDCIVDSLGETTNLAHYLANHEGIWDEDVLYNLLYQIAEALDYAHGQREGKAFLTHHRLKLSNLLVGGKEKQLQVYLSDFGLARIVGLGTLLNRTYKVLAESLGASNQNNSYNQSTYKEFSEDPTLSQRLHETFLQNYQFLAPEQKRIAQTGEVGPKSDVYAFGVLVYYLMVREYPEGIFPMPSELFTRYHYNWDHLVRSCLQYDIDKRPTLLTQSMQEMKEAKRSLFTSDIASSLDRVQQEKYENWQEPKAGPSFHSNERPQAYERKAPIQAASFQEPEDYELIKQEASLGSQATFPPGGYSAVDSQTSVAPNEVSTSEHTAPSHGSQVMEETYAQAVEQSVATQQHPHPTAPSVSNQRKPLPQENKAAHSAPVTTQFKQAEPFAFKQMNTGLAGSKKPISLATAIPPNEGKVSAVPPALQTNTVVMEQEPDFRASPAATTPQKTTPPMTQEPAFHLSQSTANSTHPVQAHATFAEQEPSSMANKPNQAAAIPQPWSAQNTQRDSYTSEAPIESKVPQQAAGSYGITTHSHEQVAATMTIPASPEAYAPDVHTVHEGGVEPALTATTRAYQPPTPQNEMKPVLKEAKVERPTYEKDPSSVFKEQLNVTQYQPKPVEIQEVEPIFTEMAVIAGGDYQRGSQDGNRDEMPKHSIYVESFAMDVHPVTNEQFIRFLEVLGGEKDNHNNDIIRLRDSRIRRSGGKLSIESGYSKHPVVGVTWYGAMAYCKWVGKRLPTEAEWEIACLGGHEGATYPTGEGIEKNQSNFFSADTTTVMSYAPNEYGLYDMVGNVYEWCQDWYGYNFYEESAQEPENPKGPLQGVYRVLRGGCWKSLKEDLRCSHRHRNNPGTVNSTYGFRCAANAE